MVANLSKTSQISGDNKITHQYQYVCNSLLVCVCLWLYPSNQMKSVLDDAAVYYWYISADRPFFYFISSLLFFVFKCKTSELKTYVTFSSSAEQVWTLVRCWISAMMSMATQGRVYSAMSFEPETLPVLARRWQSRSSATTSSCECTVI